MKNTMSCSLHRRLPLPTLWCWALLFMALAPLAARAELPLLTVQGNDAVVQSAWDGRVEAERQAHVAAQVPGRIVALQARAGDRVRAGDVLLRLHADASQKQTAASSAQVAAAQAALDVATSELARKRELAARKYISASALEQAQSQYRAAHAQVQALQAQTGAARAQEDLHVIRAPWDAIVAEVSVEQGDMAQPGQPLLVLYDPAALRVSAHVPTSSLGANSAQGAKLWLPDAGNAVPAEQVRILPTVDARSLTREVRATLPTGTAAVPGQFARLLLTPPAAGVGATAPRIFIPTSSIVRRAEMVGVYVASAQQRPQLRQLRLGRALGDQVEVLSGLDMGEQIVVDPQAALRALAAARGQERER